MSEDEIDTGLPGIAMDGKHNDIERTTCASPPSADVPREEDGARRVSNAVYTATLKRPTVIADLRD